MNCSAGQLYSTLLYAVSLCVTVCRLCVAARTLSSRERERESETHMHTKLRVHVYVERAGTARERLPNRDTVHTKRTRTHTIGNIERMGKEQYASGQRMDANMCAMMSAPECLSACMLCEVMCEIAR